MIELPPFDIGQSGDIYFEFKTSWDKTMVLIHTIGLVTNMQIGFLVEGSWEDWTSWSDCSDTCGVGTRVRSRVHNAGQPCSGSPAESEDCQSDISFLPYNHCLFS